MPGKGRRKAGHEAIGLFPRDKPEEFVGGEGELRGAVGNAETGGTGREGIVEREKGIIAEVGDADGKQITENVSVKKVGRVGV